MSVHTADSRFSFQLPSLSYIDTQWEEPNLHTATTQAARKDGLAAWLSRRVAAFIAWRRNSAAMSELLSMSDRDLMDIGMNRSDLVRAFDPALNEDLRQRGA